MSHSLTEITYTTGFIIPRAHKICIAMLFMNNIIDYRAYKLIGVFDLASIFYCLETAMLP